MIFGKLFFPALGANAALIASFATLAVGFLARPIGGLIFGLSRKAATEFSFFLAIPTIFGATVWDLWQAREQLVAANLPGLAVGTVVSFFSALVVVHWLIRFVSRHDFRGFGWYRIIFGGVILLTWATGLVSW